MQEEKREEQLCLGTDERTPLIIEEESAEAGDRPNACRSCAGSNFC